MSKKAEAKIEKVNDESVFKKAVLLACKFRGWGGTKKVNLKELLNVSEDNVWEKKIRAMQELLDDKGMDLLSAIRQNRTGVKTRIKYWACHFPIDGLDFVWLDHVDRVEELLVAGKQRDEELVEDFVSYYTQAQQNFATEYPELYDEANYPTEAWVKSKFKFNWSWTSMGPNEQLKTVSPELLRQEREKFKQDIAEIKRYTVNQVAKELIERINSLSKQCDDGKINSATVSGIDNFLERVNNVFRGLVDDADLTKMVSDVREYMKGTDAEMLRVDESFRGMVSDKMKKVTETIENKTLKRSLEF